MQDRLGAFCTDQNVCIPGCVSGPLSGLTFAAKDVFDVSGYPTGAGNPDWLRTHPIATHTASAVQNLLNAGATLTGKTHTDGTPVNPNAPGRIPGGSSSGSAAAVAGNLVDFALGTDTGGSVRLPAGNCGIYGFRPTHGRIPNDHVVPLAPSFDTVGWFARDAATLARVGRVLLANDRIQHNSPRFLLATDALELVFEDMRPSLDSAIDRINTVLGPARNVSLYGGNAEHWMMSFRILQGVEAWGCHGDWIRNTRPELGPEIRDRFDWAASIDKGKLPPARDIRDQVTAHLYNLLGNDGVLCIPTTPSIALPEKSAGQELEKYRSRALALLCTAGLARLPQVSLPLASFDGCPMGVSLIGPRDSDHWLLDLAALQLACP